MQGPWLRCPGAALRPGPDGTRALQPLSRGRRRLRPAPARPPRSRVPRPAGRDQRPPPPGVPHRQPADLPGQRHRLGRHGGGLRQRRVARATWSVVGVNGVFGERMCDVAGRVGAEVVRVEAPWGRPLDPQALLDAHPSPKVIAAVHAETSTGVRNDVACLGQTLRHQDAEALVLRRLRHLAGRHPGRDRRLAGRPGLQRHPEVPGRARPAWPRSPPAPGPSSAWSSGPSRGTSTSTCWPAT